MYAAIQDILVRPRVYDVSVHLFALAQVNMVSSQNVFSTAQGQQSVVTFMFSGLGKCGGAGTIYSSGILKAIQASALLIPPPTVELTKHEHLQNTFFSVFETTAWAYKYAMRPYVNFGAQCWPLNEVQPHQTTSRRFFLQTTVS